MTKLNFKKLTIEDRNIIEKFTSQFPPYSDFSFLSLFTYNTNESLEYAFHNDNLIVKFEDYLSGEGFYSVLGKNKIKETKELLLKETASQSDLKNSLELIPHTAVRSDPEIEKFFQVLEDRDNFDYIVSSTDIAELTKEKFPKKRQTVDRFKTKYPQVSVLPIDLSDPKNQQAVLDLLRRWQAVGRKTEKEVAVELAAIKRLLDHAKHFTNLYAVGVYDKEQLVGFNSFDINEQGYGISSFQKADKNYEGIYAFLTHEAAKKMVELGVKYINFEQDLGIEGLRASKSSWHPVKFLKKYKVAPKK